MCIIIDANQAGDLTRGERPYVKVVLEWIDSGGAIVTGGDLERELFKLGKMRGLLNELSRSGQLKQIRPERVLRRQQQIVHQCKSNDPHVVALAIEANTRLIVTEDKNLIADLKNLSIVGTRRKIVKENSASPERVDRIRKLLSSANCN